MGGFRIGTVRGIPIRIHITFLLVLPFLALAFARAFQAAARLAEVPPGAVAGAPWMWGLGIAVGLFASVLVHELAHSLYALRKGGRVQGVTLLMIGGVSQISEPPKDARSEAVMALVGPLVSLALGGLFYLAHAVAPTWSFSVKFALFYLAGLNVILGLFNLLPAFPMDGGRILRALLVPRFGPVTATTVASRVGKGFAVLFGIVGLFSFNLLLLLIAFFVFIGAEAETRSVIARALLGQLRARDLMTKQLCCLPAALSVRDAAERMVRERRLTYATALDGGQFGIITDDAVRAVASERRPDTPIRAIAALAPPLAADDDAAEALRLMSESEVPQLVVVEDGEPVGTISREDIVRGLRLTELESTLHSGRGPSGLLPHHQAARV